MTDTALTGATGFVGRRLLAMLLAENPSVRALAREGRTLPEHEHLSRITGSLSDVNALKSLVSGADVVIHLAGATSGFDYRDLARTNVAGCQRLLQAMATSAPAARLIHVSSLAAREPQLSDYAASKHAGEEVVHAAANNWLIIRPPAVYGPEDPALAPLWRLLARGWLPRIGSDQARFSLLHVDDLCSALIRSAEGDWPENTLIELHDGRPDGYSWNEIAAIAADIRGRRVRAIKVPEGVLKAIGATHLALARMRRTRPPVLVPNKVSELVHPDWVCDNTRLPGCPDWRPIRTLENSLTTLPGWKKFQ